MEAARSFCPGIAFLDLGMPRVDGYALARMFRITAELKPTILVALSGHGDPKDRERARRAGFDAHVLKPAEAPLVESILAQFGAE